MPCLRASLAFLCSGCLPEDANTSSQFCAYQERWFPSLARNSRLVPSIQLNGDSAALLPAQHIALALSPSRRHDRLAPAQVSNRVRYCR